MDTILVTGGSGRLGPYVLDKLGRDSVVRTLDVVPPAVPSTTYIAGSVLDYDALLAACEGVRTVVHLAAHPQPMNGPARELIELQAMGTANALEAAVRAGAEQFVYLSSSWALGNMLADPTFPPDYLPVDEGHPLWPADPYSVSKQIAESLCHAYHRSHGIQVFILRPSWITYPSEYAQLREYVEHDSWDPVRSLLAYVDPRDVARAVRRCVDNFTLMDEVFYLNAPDILSNHPTHEIIERHFAGVASRCDRWGPRAPLITCARADAVLGFTPKYSWHEYFPLEAKPVTPAR